MTFLDSVNEDDQDQGESKSMQLIGQLNMAACHLKLREHYRTVGCCEKALELDKDNIKAYFRRGQVCHFKYKLICQVKWLLAWQHSMFLSFRRV